MVTGTKSYTRLEHTGRIKDTRDDPAMPAHIRAMAETAWHDITTNGGSPEKQWKQIRAAITEHNATNAVPSADGAQDDPADLAAVAQDALARPRKPRSKAPTPDDRQPSTPRAARALAEVVADLDEWIDQADVDALSAHANISDLARLHHATERLDHLCTGVHTAHRMRHPALRRKKPAGAQGHAVTEEQPPLW
jgi:hypothetical protein